MIKGNVYIKLLEIVKANLKVGLYYNSLLSVSIYTAS